MSKTALSFAQDVTLKTVTQSIVDFEAVKTETESTIKATVTTPQDQDLVNVEVDSALAYKKIYSVQPVKIDDIFEFENIDYKVIKLSNRGSYGFYVSLGEELKNA